MGIKGTVRSNQDGHMACVVSVGSGVSLRETRLCWTRLQSPKHSQYWRHLEEDD